MKKKKNQSSTKSWSFHGGSNLKGPPVTFGTYQKARAGGERGREKENLCPFSTPKVTPNIL